MRKIEIKVFSINELSEDAQEKAYQKWIEHFDYVWAGENKDTLDEFEKLFPVEVTNWSYDTCDYNIRFRMTCDDEIAELRGQRLATYIVNNYYNSLYKGKYYSKNINGTFKSRRSKIIKEASCVLTGYCMDEDILEPIYKFLKNPCEHTTFEDLMEDCLNSWGRACRNDCEHSSSFEYFIEEAMNNEWEYDENGRQVY